MADTRPTVTYVVLSFMQERYIHEAVRSALSQDFASAEFIFSDDHSSDDTYRNMCAAVELHAKSSQSVTVLKMERNLGLSAHIACVMRRARGSIIVFQAGDDVAHPDRTSRLVAAFREDPDVQMVMSNVRIIDRGGRVLRTQYAPQGWAYPPRLEDLVAEDFPYLIGASEAIRREVFDLFGPMRYSECYEDRAFAFRAALVGRLRFVDGNLLDWRHHGSNMSNFVDFKSADARGRFRAHFLKNLRCQVIYLRQHLLDLGLEAGRLDPSVLSKVSSILTRRLAAKRLEFAARSPKSWPVFCLYGRHAWRSGNGPGWVLKQLMIRLGHRAYFWMLSRRVKASLETSPA